jgi:ssDNA-binding Zn-finger/Zn-ribbon topoisomerase 1
MTNTCPDCGATMELEQREVRLRTGVCPACAKEFAFVEGEGIASRLSSPPSASEEEPEGEAEDETTGGGPECEECGTPLAFRAAENGSLEVVCTECDTTTVFVPKSEAVRPPREAPPRFEGEMPRGRPCRRCGAPLRFSTGEDGLLVGECASCGNRFTLPPRPDRGGGGRGYRGAPRTGRRDFRRSPGGRPPYPGRGGHRPFRRFDRRGGPRDEDEDRPRKRRRPRDE